MEGTFDPSAPLIPDPPALKAPSAAAGVSDVSGLGSLGLSAVSALEKLVAGVSINPITGESGLIDKFLPKHSTPSCRSLGLDLFHAPKDVGP